MRSCYCRSTVCANREGRCTPLQRRDRIMMSCGNIPASFLNPQILSSCSAHDRNQHGPLLWRCSNPTILRSKLALASGFGGCCWLTSKCPSCPQSSLPSDTVLGAVIPAGLAFQNKGCMFSVCLSKEGCITAGLTDKQTEAGEPRPNLATLSQNCPRISLFVQIQLAHEGFNREKRSSRQTTCAPYALWRLVTQHPKEDSTQFEISQSIKSSCQLLGNYIKQ